MSFAKSAKATPAPLCALAAALWARTNEVSGVASLLVAPSFLRSRKLVASGSAATSVVVSSRLSAPIRLVSYSASLEGIGKSGSAVLSGAFKSGMDMEFSDFVLSGSMLRVLSFGIGARSRIVWAKAPLSLRNFLRLWYRALAHNKPNNFAPSAQDAAKPRLFLRRYATNQSLSHG